MNPYELKITLRITHPILTLPDITRALSIKPSGGWTAGERRVTPAGRPLKGTHKETYWYRSLPISHNAQLNKSVKTLISRLSSKKNFFKKVRAKGGKVEFYVGLFINRNSGESLDQDLLKDLSDLQIDLALDIYPPRHNTRKRSG